MCRKNINNLVVKNDSFDYNLKYDYAIVLGCNKYDIMIDRLDATMYLYNKGLIKKIILSGGKTSFSKYKTKEAYIMRDYLLENNVDSLDIILEDKSRNTYENIYNSINLIDRESVVLLITSDFHIKRAFGLLKKKIKDNIYYYSVLTNLKKHKRLVKLEYYLISYYKWKKYI